MRTYSMVVERDQETGFYVGYVPGWPGAQSQGASLDELQGNLQEVIEMLLEDQNSSPSSSASILSGWHRWAPRSRS